MTPYPFDPDNYQQQLQDKQARMGELFQSFNPPPLEVFASPPSHYRMRAEFKLWHQDDRCYYAMQPPGDKSAAPTLMTQFPVASNTINRVMPELLPRLEANPELKRRLFQVEFLSTTTEELLITLIYHRPLNQDWIDVANQLKQQLTELEGISLRRLNIIGRSRKQKIVLDQDYVEETLTVRGREFHYQQVENSFTQPNASVCQAMLSWACDCAQGLGGDLLELYCGNGNFTLPLAQHFNRVLATEISKTSVNSAKLNIAANNSNNIEIARLSSEEFTEAFTGVRPFRRLAEIDLPSYQFSTVFVDPPRAGLDQGTLNLVSGFDNILYISCNPETLKNNLETLAKNHSLTRFALFDQFPYTEHMEAGVLLQKR